MYQNSLAPKKMLVHNVRMHAYTLNKADDLKLPLNNQNVFNDIKLGIKST